MFRVTWLILFSVSARQANQRIQREVKRLLEGLVRTVEFRVQRDHSGVGSGAPVFSVPSDDEEAEDGEGFFFVALVNVLFCLSCKLLR